MALYLAFIGVLVAVMVVLFIVFAYFERLRRVSWTIWFVLYILFGAVDVLTTYVLVSRFGVDGEINLFGKFLMENFGIMTGLVLGKLIVVSVLLLLGIRYGNDSKNWFPRFITFFLAIFSILPCINNLTTILSN